MLKMWKKWIGVLLVCGLCSGLLTGCQQESKVEIPDDNYRNYYEIFVYSFYDSDGDGIGDLNGVTQKLDYIEDMGFTGIWLMPIFDSTTYHKYDVTNYMEIDPQYGTMEDFENLAAECNKREIKLILDLVINHSSSKHPWFVEACEYLRGLDPEEEPDAQECPYIDYYYFAREQENSDYYAVNGSEWYYEGVFWSEMPDLNLQSTAVREEIEQIAKFWLDKGVDGYRMDAAMHFVENNTQSNVEILDWLYEYCKSIDPDCYMVSEVWANETTIAEYYASQTPSMFNFDAGNTEGRLIKAARGNYKAENFVQSMLKYQTDFETQNPDAIDAPFLTNHDMGRVANALRNDVDDIKMAGGLLLTMSGNPFVYYGEEIGMSSKGTKDENKRLPMIWSDTDTTGITTKPADADAGITSSFAGVEEQLADETSILQYYKRALCLRNENPEIARGKMAIVEELCDGHLAAITKTWEDSTIAIVYNTSDEAMQVTLTDTALAQMKVKGYLTKNNEEITIKGGVLQLPAQSICVLK